MKKTFVLLEVLIGFALVSLSILPFLRFPHKHMRQELDMLFEMELHKHGQTRLADIEVLLRTNKIDQKWIFASQVNNGPYSEEVCTLILSPSIKRSYKEVVKIKWTAQKLDNDRLMSSLVHVYIKYHDRKKKTTKFHGELVVQKKI